MASWRVARPPAPAMRAGLRADSDFFSAPTPEYGRHQYRACGQGLPVHSRERPPPRPGTGGRDRPDARNPWHRPCPRRDDGGEFACPRKRGRLLGGEVGGQEQHQAGSGSISGHGRSVGQEGGKNGAAAPMAPARVRTNRRGRILSIRSVGGCLAKKHATKARRAGARRAGTKGAADQAAAFFSCSADHGRGRRASSCGRGG